MFSSSRRKVSVLLLTAVLLSPAAAAAATGNPQGTRSPWVVLAQLWNIVAALWGESGCSMDPYGSCQDSGTPPVPAENIDNGCSVDPFGGGCRSGR